MEGIRYEFYFRVIKTILYEWAQRMKIILFLTFENKIYIFKPLGNFLVIVLTETRNMYKLEEMTFSISSLMWI